MYACVHKIECSYMYKYLRLYYVSSRFVMLESPAWFRIEGEGKKSRLRLGDGLTDDETWHHHNKT
jgi:hypothetical protein